MWDDPKALFGIAATLAAMACVALSAATVGWIARLPAFAIHEVAFLTPPVRASAAQLETAIRDELHGTFFTMDLEAARSAIANVAWVRSASIRRQWPHRLEVAIEEHVPLARWNDSALVNTFGERFLASHEAQLPQFNGPDGYAGEMTRRYREWSAMLEPLGIGLVGLDLTPRGGWRVHASSAAGPLTLELGRDDAPARLARFVAGYGRTLGALARGGMRIEHVDLRYRNGFAARVPGFRESTSRKTP